MTSDQLTTATQAIAKEHGCDRSGDFCPAADKGDPCLCERFALVALKAGERTIESRLTALERWSHEPFDFTHLVARLDAIEQELDAAKAVAL